MECPETVVSTRPTETHTSLSLPPRSWTQTCFGSRSGNFTSSTYGVLSPPTPAPLERHCRSTRRTRSVSDCSSYLRRSTRIMSFGWTLFGVAPENVPLITTREWAWSNTISGGLLDLTVQFSESRNSIERRSVGMLVSVIGSSGQSPMNPETALQPATPLSPALTAIVSSCRRRITVL